MENLIARKMDEEKHKEKVKELQDKYIPFLEQVIKKLQCANAEKSREQQLKKMQSLHDLLKNKPKQLKPDILEKTEQVLVNLYQKLGPGSHDKSTSENEVDNSKAIALKPNMEVDLRNSNNMNLDVIKQKLLNVPTPQSETNASNYSSLKQKASAIINDKTRQHDPRTVSSEITVHVNRISTVISSRSNQGVVHPQTNIPILPESFPIPVIDYQNTQSVDLYCRRMQDKTFFQRRLPMSNETPIPNALPGPSTVAIPGMPPKQSDGFTGNEMDILKSPPLSNDDIHSLMEETTTSNMAASTSSTTTIRQCETVRLALKYNPHPKRPIEKSSSHLPIEPTGNITVSLDDPRLKKPLPPPQRPQHQDPRRDNRRKYDPPTHTAINRFDSRKSLEFRSNVNRYNVPQQSKSNPINSMDRRSELDDDYDSTLSGFVPSNPARNNSVDRSRTERCVPHEDILQKKSSDSAVSTSKSQFDDMYRKNNFSQDYNKHVKNINKGIKDFKIPKKPTPSQSNAKIEHKIPETTENKTIEKKTSEKALESKEKSVDSERSKTNVESEEKKKKKKKKKEISEENDIGAKPPVGSATIETDTSNVTSITVLSDVSSEDEERLKNVDKKDSTQKSNRRRIKILSSSESEKSESESEVLLSNRTKEQATKKKHPKKRQNEKTLTDQDTSTGKARPKKKDPKKSVDKNVFIEKEVSSSKTSLEKEKPRKRKNQKKDGADKIVSSNASCKAKKKIAPKYVEKIDFGISDSTSSTEIDERSKSSSPEPVSSSSQVDTENAERTEGTDSVLLPTSTNAESEPKTGVITKEWLEGIVSKAIISQNVTSSDKLLDMMKSVLDEDKFEKVRSILQGDDKDVEMKSDEAGESSKTDKIESLPETPTEDGSSTSADTKPRHKRHRRELDMLYEDIRTMFISEGVLTATGRRMCTDTSKKPVNYAESSATSSPQKPKTPTKPRAYVGQKPGPKSKTRPEESKRVTRQIKPVEDDDTSNNEQDNENANDEYKQTLKYIIEQHLDSTRTLQVSLNKLKPSDIKCVKKSIGKKKKPKTDASEKEPSTSESTQNVGTPKKKIKRRNNIWFKGDKRKPSKQARAAANAALAVETTAVETTTSTGMIDLPPPELTISNVEIEEVPKKKPGPKPKTPQNDSSENKNKGKRRKSVAPSDRSTAANSPLNLDFKIKQEKTQLTNVSNIDVNHTVLNNNKCQICNHKGKNMVHHYLKEHPQNEVFCSRLPKNISDFLKSNKAGMLHADSYGMKLQYSGSKIFGLCIFCQEEMYESPKQWLTHYTKHTGEFEIVCTCGFKTWTMKSMRHHIKQCPERGSYSKNDIAQDNIHHIEAYMCGECNFVQLREENLRNHLITEHTTPPRHHTVVLLNFSDESVKTHRTLFMEMFKSMQNTSKQNKEDTIKQQEEGIFKTTNDKDGEDSVNHSVLAEISENITSEPVKGIANKLHERLTEKLKVTPETSAVVKNEAKSIEDIPLSSTAGNSTQTTETQLRKNFLEHDDDEWEDIDSDSDESIISQSGKSSSNKKISRLAQRIGLKVGAKRKSDASADLNAGKKIKVEPSDLSPLTDLAVNNDHLEDGESGKVENLMFKHISFITSYHCLVEKCLYISGEVDNFTGHLIKVHDDDTWSGYCSLCKCNMYPEGQTLIKEFHHLVNDHVRQHSTELISMKSEVPKEDTKPPAIRIRRLSGDKLSVKSEVFKLPTTPKSITIRRITKSPEERASPSASAVSPTSSLLSKVSMPTKVPFTPTLRAQQSILKPLLSNVSNTLSAMLNAAPTMSSAPSGARPPIQIRALPTEPSFAADDADISLKAPQAGKIRMRRLTVSGGQVLAEKSGNFHTYTKSFSSISGQSVAGPNRVQNPLKPWTKQTCTKSPSVVEKMLQKEVLLAPFKCMGSECWYYTSSELDMATHLQCHENAIEEQLDQTTISDTSSWLECAYCDYMAGNGKDLIEHQRKTHLDSEYLCPKCFYRGCHANYVARHLDITHKTNCNIWQIKPYIKPNHSAENPIFCVRNNVKLLTCKTCGFKFLNYINFESHLKEHADDVFECNFCTAMVKIENMKKHMSCHSVGHFECIYCPVATVRKDLLAQHMCDKHSNQKLIYYNRDRVNEHVDKFKLSEFDDFWVSRVTIESIKDVDINYIDPKAAFGLSSNMSTSSVIVSQPNSSGGNDQAQTALPLIISNVVSLRQEPPKSVTATTPIASASQFPSFVIKNVCSLPKDNSMCLTPSGSKEVFDVSGSSFPKIVAVSGVATQQRVVPVKSYGSKVKTQEKSTATAIKEAIENWVSKTGTPLVDLLKCSEQNCGYQASNESDFKQHINYKHASSLLKCSQCVNVFWPSLPSLWAHLETHGQKRFFCFECDCVTKTEKQIEDHCQGSVHNWLNIALIPLTNEVSGGGAYLSCPLSTTKEKIEHFKAELVRSFQQRETGSAANVATTNIKSGKECYGPEDIELLPTKPVVADNIYCKLCDYKTPILKNLIRHFDAHRQATYVPNLDPVNPVPCLTGNEKNFDKMTNLACSSNIHANKGKTNSVNEPPFIAQQKRFVCGVNDCAYISIDEVMLRQHLNTLHSTETSYKCPHCNVELLAKGHFTVDAIIMHYRLHGAKLYMCEKCQFLNDSLTNIEKHIKNIHSGNGNIIALRDESKPETVSAIANDPVPFTSDGRGVKRWRCNVCSETTGLKVDMATHVLTRHNHKYQYKCGYCDTLHCSRNFFTEHIKTRHDKAEFKITETYSFVKISPETEQVNFWRRDESGTKSIRGIPCEASEIQPKSTEGEDEDDYVSEDDYVPDITTSTSLFLNRSVDTAEGAKRKADDTVLSMQMKKPRVERLVQCTICDKITKSALIMQVKHFPECHPGLPVSTRIISSDTSDGKGIDRGTETALKAFHGYSLQCYQCKMLYKKFEDLKKHYIGNHAESNAVKCHPCWYRADRLMWCGLCHEVQGTYHQIGRHLEKAHNSNVVIATTAKDNMICGACEYSAGDDQSLLRHARLRHTNTGIPGIFISPAALDEMLTVELFPMKKCTMCKETICDIDGRQCENHLRLKHSASIIPFIVPLRNPAYICYQCKQIFDSETSAYTHMLLHKECFKCSYCNEFYARYEIAADHMKSYHSGDINVIRFAFPTEELLQILVVFPNGLILSLDQLENTKFKFDQNKFKLSRNEIVRKLN